MQKWAERVTHAVVADARNIDALRQIGAQDFSIAVVRRRLVDRGIRAHHREPRRPQGPADLGEGDLRSRTARSSQRIGANHVIYPEREAGERVAHLVSGRMLDFIEFDDDFALVKMYPPKSIRGKNLTESGVRSKYNVTVVGVKSPGKPFRYAEAEHTVVSNHDLIIVSGTEGDIEKFAALE